MEPALADTEPLIDVEGPVPTSESEEERRLYHTTSTLSVDTDGSKTIDTDENGAFKNTPEFYARSLRPPGHSPPVAARMISASYSRTSSDFGGEDEDDEDELPSRMDRRSFTEPTSSRTQSFFRRLRFRVTASSRKFFKFMTMPLWAALLSLVVACIRPLQHALEEHVQPIKGALTSAGNCSIPVTLVVLGAYFYTPPDASANAETERPDRRSLPSPTTAERDRSVSTMSHSSLLDNMRDMFSMKRRSRRDLKASAKQETARPGETKTVLVAVLSRMIITPLLLLPMIALSTKFDMQRVFEE